MSDVSQMERTKAFRGKTREALAEVITGGRWGSTTPSIGHYRSAYDLHKFFAGLDMKFDVGGASRVPAVECFLESLNLQSDGTKVMISILEAVSDPAEYVGESGKVIAVVEYLNERLKYDNMELRLVGKRYKVVPLSLTSTAGELLSEKAEGLRFESVKDDFDRAVEQAETDPEGAVTSACSTLESVCKCLLDEMGVTYPAKEDVSSLTKAVEEKLNLAPNRADLAPDIKQILGGLSNVSRGIGVLRTHSGDAHGKGKNRYRIDPRIARLAIHAASTVSLFFIETWQRRVNENTG